MIFVANNISRKNILQQVAELCGIHLSKRCFLLMFFKPFLQLDLRVLHIFFFFLESQKFAFLSFWKHTKGKNYIRVGISYWPDHWSFSSWNDDGWEIIFSDKNRPEFESLQNWPHLLKVIAFFKATEGHLGMARTIFLSFFLSLHVYIYIHM